MPTLKKSAQPKGNPERPATVVLRNHFPKEGARRVSSVDLEKAAEAAATAYRTTLEQSATPYEVLDLTAEVTYGYELVKSRRAI